MNNIAQTEDSHMITVIEIDKDKIESHFRKPAVTSRMECYLISDNHVVGKVRIVSARSFPAGSYGLYESVSIEPDDPATTKFFENDPSMIACGMLLNVRYDGIYGDRFLTGQDGDDPLYLDTKIVDTFEFDFGICHPSFKDVEGFDNYHKRPKPRHSVPQKSRRSRNSNKIKKVK